MAEITIIPAKGRSDEVVRTAAYARVSSSSEDQLNSFAAQIRYYTELLKDSTNAVFVDMYADEGISGTSAAKRADFQRLMLNSQGTLDGAYFKERTQELDRKLMNAQKRLHAGLDDKDGERLDELRKLIGIFGRAKPITDFDEIKFGHIVEKITVLSESEIRFDLIGRIGFTERIVR